MLVVICLYNIISENLKHTGGSGGYHLKIYKYQIYISAPKILPLKILEFAGIGLIAGLHK